MNCRVIPRLDIKGPNLVKGLSFDGYRALGTAEYFARVYYEEGADELIYYDSVASLYQRNSLQEIVSKTAKEIFIPLTVAGGIRSMSDIRDILRAGADKVAINTAALQNPQLIRDASNSFGSQCIVVSIEAKRLSDGSYEAWCDYGRQPTGIDVFEWVEQAVDLGAGEVLVTSVDRDGMCSGYDIELNKKIAEMVPVPVIACGGAGSTKDVIELLNLGRPDAISAASIFHYYYMETPESLYMSSDDPSLRMGHQTDEGNVDFIRARACGGLPWTLVRPESIGNIKRSMIENGFSVRYTPHLGNERGIDSL